MVRTTSTKILLATLVAFFMAGLLFAWRSRNSGLVLAVQPLAGPIGLLAARLLPPSKDGHSYKRSWTLLMLAGVAAALTIAAAAIVLAPRPIALTKLVKQHHGLAR